MRGEDKDGRCFWKINSEDQGGSGSSSEKGNIRYEKINTMMKADRTHWNTKWGQGLPGWPQYCHRLTVKEIGWWAITPVPNHCQGWRMSKQASTSPLMETYPSSLQHSLATPSPTNIITPPTRTNTPITCYYSGRGGVWSGRGTWLLSQMSKAPIPCQMCQIPREENSWVSKKDMKQESRNSMYVSWELQEQCHGEAGGDAACTSKVLIGYGTKVEYAE